MATRKTATKRKSTQKSAGKPTRRVDRKNILQIPVVGVGASAGGLEAFKQLFATMPVDTGMAFVLVQHLDPTHESMMVDLLNRYTDMKVIQVEEKMKIEPNQVYMIPINKDMAVHNGEFYLTAPALPRGIRMPIDFFLRSLAEDKQELAICIILSGTGSDGTLGLKAVKGYGGMAMVQEPFDAQYDGMPTSAISTGIVDYVLPVSEIPTALEKYAHHSYVRGFFGIESVDGATEKSDLTTILSILHSQLGHNFHHYKKNTLLRRIQRRMSLKQLVSMKIYADVLRNNKEETNELFKDMLIGVTGFFREAQAWADLEKLFISKALNNPRVDIPFRVWVSGCASGEEAYTIAMVIMDHIPENNSRDFQIFATDIDKNALEIARTGRYPETIAAEVSPGRLNKYFRKEDEFYQITNLVRDHIVFSEQNLISDPPFSKLDLIICRNLLIYLETEVQSKVFELCHFALNNIGYLMLGTSETIGQHIDLFDAVSKKWRIFKKINTTQRPRTTFPILPDNRKWDRFALTTLAPDKKATTIKAADLVQNLLLDQYAPASVLINRKHQILYHFGNTIDYLYYPTGEPTDDLFSVIRDGLITRMRSAVHRAIRDENVVDVSGARVKRDGKHLPVKFSIRPLKALTGGDGLFLVSFEDDVRLKSTKPDLQNHEDYDEPVVRQLEDELSATKEDLQTTIEELETSNEELKATNEELMSMNEELQSSNEELETSKEELQSLNEELNTVNNELQEKISTLESSNNDFSNLVNSTNNAAIFVDSQKSIKFFTPVSKSLFNLIGTDIGRSISDITPKFDDPVLYKDIDGVLKTLHSSNREIQTNEGKWFYRRILPYRTHDNRILGAVIVFDDITIQKQLVIEPDDD